jgi:hypothetical protein
VSYPTNKRALNAFNMKLSKCYVLAWKWIHPSDHWEGKQKGECSINNDNHHAETKGELIMLCGVQNNILFPPCKSRRAIV